MGIIEKNYTKILYATEAFYKDPRTFMSTYGANVGGCIYSTGSTLQLLIGAAVLSPRQFISSILNLSSPLILARFGHKNWGVATGCVLGVVGTGLAVYPGLSHGDSRSIIGFAFCVAANIFGVWSKGFTNKFGEAKNRMLRHTFGNPRLFMSLINFASRLLFISEGLANGRGLSYLAPFFVWAAGDIAFSFSRPDMSANPVSMPKNALL